MIVNAIDVFFCYASFFFYSIVSIIHRIYSAFESLVNFHSVFFFSPFAIKCIRRSQECIWMIVHWERIDFHLLNGRVLLYPWVQIGNSYMAKTNAHGTSQCQMRLAHTNYLTFTRFFLLLLHLHSKPFLSLLSIYIVRSSYCCIHFHPCTQSVFIDDDHSHCKYLVSFTGMW